MNKKSSVYWWVEATIEFLPGKRLCGLEVSPRFSDKSLAEMAQGHLCRKYGVKGEVVSTLRKSVGRAH